MLSFAIGAVLLAVPALWWAFVRETTIVFPHALAETVESESFRRWLGEEATWLIWGRDRQGRYYAVVPGSLAARRFRDKVRALHDSEPPA